MNCPATAERIVQRPGSYFAEFGNPVGFPIYAALKVQNLKCLAHMAMDQYLLIPFLGG